MKELTIEEKAKRYDEAIDKIGDAVEAGTIEQGLAEWLFPELKESEDEQSKKWILEYLYDGLRKSDEQFKDQFKSAIAWLEKQGKNYIEKYINDERNKIGFYYEGKEVSWNEMPINVRKHDYPYYFKGDLDFFPFNIEKQSEQKPANTVKPKFHEGEWVVDNCNNIWKIEAILSQFYILKGVEGDKSVPTIEWADKTFHLWTINDAKDGDVLASKEGNPFIYDKNRYNNGLAYYYAGLGVNNKLTIKSPHNMLAHFGKLRSVSPATKEQRDFLFQKMHNAGYEFDIEKKELKKIEDKPLVIDEGKDEIDRNFTEMMLKGYNRKMPKFHKGEWVVNQLGYIKQIIDIKDDHYYCLINNDGNDNCHWKLPIEYADKYWHKWTINDAKPGDVLVVDNIIFIYKRILSSHIVSYCKLINDKFEHFEDARTCCEGNTYVHPATKEQRDLLFQKMHEAGYEWDTKKNVLKEQGIFYCNENCKGYRDTGGKCFFGSDCPSRREAEQKFKQMQ